MDAPRLLEILKKLPESRPMILDLALELTDENGRMGAELTEDQENLVAEAEQEARTHSAATHRLARDLRSFMIPRHP